MGAPQSFDDFDSTESLHAEIEQIEPFPLREDTTEEGTLEWLNGNFTAKEEKAYSRLITYRRYVYLYKGIHWRNTDLRDSNRDIEYNPRKPRIVINFVYEMTEQKVAQMARLNIAFACIPHTRENEDVNAARASKLMLMSRGEEIKLELLHIQADRTKFIKGTVFQFVLWDKKSGPKNPAYDKALSKTIKRKGNTKKMKVPVRAGDVIVKNLGPDRVFPELECKRWEECKEIEWIEWTHHKELKAQHPTKKEKIQENQRQHYDYRTNEISIPTSKVMVRHFYYLPCDMMPEGCYIKYTDDVILEKTVFPYKHGRLPCAIDTDIDVEDELWGRSFITNIEQLQRLNNSIWSSSARDFGVASAPKWMMPKGACSIHDLNNELTIVEFTGPTAPQLVTKNPTPNQSFQFTDRIENKISKLSKVYDISRGEVPAGVTANSALRFLDEQESQSAVVAEKKRKDRVIDVYKLMLEVMAQEYPKGPERMIKRIGKDNRYMIRSFKNSSFISVADIRIQNTSALPDTKTGKISAIIDLNMATQTDPVFKRAEVIQMLDMGLDETFVDQATAALSSAREILQMILEGEQAPEPEIWEDLIVHHTVFYREMQKPTFRRDVPVEIQEIIKTRMLTMETLMWNRSMSNEKFAMEIKTIDYYPLFFTPPKPQPVDITEGVPPEALQGEEGLDTSKIESLGNEEKGAQDG
jgi:hypothetical protein